MTLVRPVSAQLVTPAWAARVVSPLHDVLDETERRAVLAGNPDSYLHVASDPLSLQRLLDGGAYRRMAEPSVFVYRMREEGREHTGVVAGVHLAGFADGRVLGHEAVQPARVELLLAHYDRLGTRSELVTLFHRPDRTVAELATRVCAREPMLDFTDAGGIEQAVWRADPDEAAAMTQHLAGHRHYIADGHHRVAAALRRWERDGRPTDSTVLCAVYPQDEVSLRAFHRRVRGPVDVPGLLGSLEAGFDVRPAAGPDVAAGSVGVYAAAQWRVLTPRRPSRARGVAGLDVTLLHDRVLRPLLGVVEGDGRVEFLPDPRDLRPTLRRCDEDGGVLFTLHATRVDDLVEVAERREVMSAKTTFVEPKPRTGVFLHELY